MSNRVEKDFKEKYPKYGYKFFEYTYRLSKKDVWKIANSLNVKFENSDVFIEDFTTKPNKFSAYILGYIWADGWVERKGGRGGVQLKIIKSDAEEIKSVFFKTGGWAEQHFKNDCGNDVILFRCENKNLVRFFQNNGYKSKGTNSPHKILSFLPKELHCFFWRGYFDGDGCFTKGSVVFAGACDLDWTSLINYLSLIGITKSRIRKQITESNGSWSQLTLSDYEQVLLFYKNVFGSYYQDRIGLSRKMYKFLDTALERYTKVFVNRKGYYKNGKSYVAGAKFKDFLVKKSFKDEESCKNFLLDCWKNHNIKKYNIYKETTNLLKLYGFIEKGSHE